MLQRATSGSSLSSCVEALGERLAGVDRGVLRQAEVDQQLRPVGGGEELPRDQRKREEGRREQAEREQDRQPVRAHGEGEEAPVGAEDPAGLGACFGFGGFRMATPSSGAKITATNQDTISAMADHREQREGVFAGRARGEADRHEAGDRDQRAGEHGEGVGAEGEGRGLDLVVALRQPREHGVGRRHRVVDQQARAR